MKKKLSFNLSWFSEFKLELYGISALLIMFFHGQKTGIDWGSPLGHIFKFLNYGNVGVEVFLFLSGIYLYFSFVKDSNSLHFYRKRIVKLFPTVYLIYVPLWAYMLFSGHSTISTFLGRITLLRFWANGESMVWFVSLILVLYLLYPLIYHLLFDKNEKHLVRFFIILLIILALTVLMFVNDRAFYSNIEIALTRIPSFLLGCLLGKYVHEKKEISLIVLLVSIVVFIAAVYVLFNNMLSGIYRRYLYFFVGIPLTFILTYIFHLISRARIIGIIFRFFGRISLELYLSHLLWLYLFMHGMLPFPAYGGNHLIIKYCFILLLSVISSLAVVYIRKGVGILLKKRKAAV